MVPIGGVLATIGGEPSPSTAAAPKDTAAAAPKDTAPDALKDTPSAVPKVAPPDASKDTPPAEEPQRRAIDKKDSIKKSTGDYAEAIDMKAPRIDRTAAAASSPSKACRSKDSSSPMS